MSYVIYVMVTDLRNVRSFRTGETKHMERWMLNYFIKLNSNWLFIDYVGKGGFFVRQFLNCCSWQLQCTWALVLVLQRFV